MHPLPRQRMKIPPFLLGRQEALRILSRRKKVDLRARTHHGELIRIREENLENNRPLAHKPDGAGNAFRSRRTLTADFSAAQDALRRPWPAGTPGARVAVRGPEDHLLPLCPALCTRLGSSGSWVLGDLCLPRNRCVLFSVLQRNRTNKG